MSDVVLEARPPVAGEEVSASSSGEARVARSSQVSVVFFSRCVGILHLISTISENSKAARRSRLLRRCASAQMWFDGLGAAMPRRPRASVRHTRAMGVGRWYRQNNSALRTISTASLLGALEAAAAPNLPARRQTIVFPRAQYSL